MSPFHIPPYSQADSEKAFRLPFRSRPVNKLKLFLLEFLNSSSFSWPDSDLSLSGQEKLEEGKLACWRPKGVFIDVC